MPNDQNDNTGAAETSDEAPRLDVEGGRGEGSKVARQQAAAATTKRNTERNFQNLQQCLLCENLEMAKNYHRQNDNLFKYQTFRQIDGESHNIVSSLRGLTQVGGNRSPLEEFLNIRTAVLSMLQPKIRIYKVEYLSVHGGGAPSRGIPTALRIPIYKEIQFSDNFGEEVAPSAVEYMKYETQRPNWRNVGLKHFTFNQIGRSFGAIEHNIRCQIQIHAKGIKDLFAAAKPGGNPKVDPRYVDLLLFPGKANLESGGTTVSNPKHYEIKAFIGYSKPSSSMIKNIALSGSEMKFLKEIERFNFMVTLSLHNYDFNIADTGETVMTVDYWGRIGTATDVGTNVFDSSIVVKEGSGTKIVAKHQPSLSYASVSSLKMLLGKIIKTKKNPSLAKMPMEDLGRLLLEDKLFRDLYKKGFGKTIKVPFGDSDVANVLDIILAKDGSKTLNALLKRAGAGLKNEVYKSFMLQLLDGSNTEEEDDTRLFAISVNKENLDGALGIMNSGVAVEKDSSKAAKKARHEEIKRETSNAIGLASQTVRIGRPRDISGIKQSVDAIEGQAQENVSNSGSESDAQQGIQALGPAAKASLITGKTKGDRYEFYFLYVGDIIELAAKNCGVYAVLSDKDSVYSSQGYNRREHGINYGLTKYRLLLGPLEYVGVDGRIRSINIAEFPISFDLFRAWFLEKIVREDRTKMTFKLFLGSLINNLVMPALGAQCTTPIKLEKVEFQNLFLTLQGKTIDSGTSDTPPLTVESLPLKSTIDIKSSDFLAYARNIQMPSPFGSLIKNSYDYQLVQTSGFKSLAMRKGRCREDIKDGIYHFNIGSDRGLLKSLKFTKVNIPDLQEKMSQDALAAGGDQVRQMGAFTFNCDLELVGNTLFLPGMMFYVNPTFAGLPQASEVREVLRLGGYYLVMETKLKITPGRFTTTVAGVWVGMGGDKKSA